MKAFCRGILFFSFIFLSAFAGAQDPEPEPTVELIWRSTTGSGTTGTKNIEANVGDQLTLDVIVRNPAGYFDPCIGLGDQSVSLYWDTAVLKGFGAQTCPQPPNIFPSYCNDPFNNKLYPVISLAEVSPGKAEGFGVRHLWIAYHNNAPMYLGRISYLVESSALKSHINVGYRPGFDYLTDGCANEYTPSARATVIRPPPPPSGC